MVTSGWWWLYRVNECPLIFHYPTHCWIAIKKNHCTHPIVSDQLSAYNIPISLLLMLPTPCALYHFYHQYWRGTVIIIIIIIVITISVILACPDARWEARRLSGSLFRVFSIPGNSIKSCCKMTCFSQTENGILMGIDGIVHYEFTIHNTHKKQSGCLFQPLWNIFVTWDDDSQYMERKMFQSTNQI